MTMRGALAPMILWSALALAVGCQADPGRRQHERRTEGAAAGGGAAPAVSAMSRAGLTGGKLVLEHGFDSAQLGAPFKPHPRARIVDGWLRLENIKNVPPVWLAEPLPASVRVEFDARALTPEGDIKVEIFGDGNSHESGYIVVHGAHKNVEDWMARLGEHKPDALKRPSSGVEQGRVYHWALVRMNDGELRWFIDGEPFMSYPDKQPLTGAQHAYFAFNNWVAPVEFDNLRIYDLSQQ